MCQLTVCAGSGRHASPATFSGLLCPPPRSTKIGAASIPKVQAPASDHELAARQSALQAEAAELLEVLDRSGIFTNIGQLEVTGSYISNLMCWRELDVMLLVGS